MDRRTKILAAVFGAAIAYAAVAKVVYPVWIEPLVTIDDIIAEKEGELRLLEDEAREVFDAKMEFREYVNRVGSFDVRQVENDVRDRLNTLIATHQLEEVTVTPSRPTEDRKSGLTKMTITVSGSGTLKAATLFLRDVAELPYLLRVLNPAIYPINTARSKDKQKRAREETKVSLRVPIQLLVLPQARIVGRLDPKSLKRPDAVVRDSERNFSEIWERTPFTEYVKLDPVVATAATSKLTVEKDKRGVYLEVRVTGGDGEYTYEWRPSSGLSNGKSPKPLLDTASTGNRSYTCVVTDGRGTTATCHLNVEIKEKEKPKEPAKLVERPPTQPPPPKGPQRFKDGAKMQFTSTWISTQGPDRTAEMAVQNSSSRQTEYYHAGDAFDGGVLTYVHQSGALVLRDGAYRVYPVGAHLNEDIPVEAAVEFPRLQQVAEYHRHALEELHREAAEKEAADEEAARLEEEQKTQAGDTRSADAQPEDADGAAEPGSATREASGGKAPGAKTPGANPPASTKTAAPGRSGPDSKAGSTASRTATGKVAPGGTSAKPKTPAVTGTDGATDGTGKAGPSGSKPTTGRPVSGKPVTGRPAPGKTVTRPNAAPPTATRSGPDGPPKPREAKLNVGNPAAGRPGISAPATRAPGKRPGTTRKAPSTSPKNTVPPATTGAKGTDDKAAGPGSEESSKGGLMKVMPSQKRWVHRGPAKDKTKPRPGQPAAGNQSRPSVKKDSTPKGKPAADKTGGKEAEKVPDSPGKESGKQGEREQGETKQGEAEQSEGKQGDKKQESSKKPAGDKR